MARAKGMVEPVVTSPIPSDVSWAPEREIVMYALVPCKPTGFRILERRCSLEEAAVFGTFGERENGAMQADRISTRVARDATKP